jgi:hypothetical protein
LQVTIAEPFGHFVHRLADAQPIAEHEQLHRRVEGGLGAERRCFGNLRRALFAVAGKARRQPLIERLRAERQCRQTGDDRPEN